MAKQALFVSYFVLVMTGFIQFLKFVNTEDAPKTDDPSTWPGHMEALGSRNIKHTVPSLDHFPTPQEFFRDYVGPSKPLLIKNGAKISPAFKLWTDDYFLSLAGSESTTVFVEQGKKENRTFPGRDTSFKDFVLKYNHTDIYMVNGVPDILQKDVVLPPSLLCEDLRPYLVDTVMWFSSGGTKSVFHHDDVENINCLYSGSKTLLFVEYQKYRSKLRLDNAWGGFSGVDIDHVNFTKYPIFHDVEFHQTEMQSGDCLFIPYKWFHQVTSSGRNIAVNIWWKHLPSFIPKNCENIEKGATLDKFNFSTLEKGEGDEEGEEEPEGLLENLAKILKGGKELSFEEFVSFLKKGVTASVQPELDHDVLDFIGHVFQSADVNKDGVMTINDIVEIDDKAFVEFENDVSELEGIMGEYHDPMYPGEGQEENRHLEL